MGVVRVLEYELHPLCKLFPQMSEEEYKALVEDIRKNGLRSPVVLYEGKILDGGHRYCACKDLGVETRYCRYEGDDPLAFVASLNFARRHLSASQRAFLIAELTPRLDEEARARSEANLKRGAEDPRRYKIVPSGPTAPAAAETSTTPKPSTPKVGRAREKVAELARVSVGTAQAAIDVAKRADEPTKEAVRRGEMSVAEAATKVRSKIVPSGRTTPATAAKPKGKASKSASPPASNAPAGSGVKDELGVPLDDLRGPAAARYLELYAKLVSLHRQAVEAASDLLDSPLGVLFTEEKNFTEMQSGTKVRKRLNVLRELGSILHGAGKLIVCPYCKGAGCKPCLNVGMRPGGSEGHSYPPEYVEALRKRAAEGKPMEPLAAAPRAVWEAKHLPLPSNKSSTKPQPAAAGDEPETPF